MPGRREALALLFCAAAASPAPAQGGPALRAIPDAEATQEILDLREGLRAAVARKDRAALEGFYADNFQHLRDTSTGQSAPYRWLTVYVRTGEGWRVALSQASRVAQTR